MSKQREPLSPEEREFYRSLKKQRRSGQSLTADETRLFKALRQQRRAEKDARWIAKAAAVGVDYAILGKRDRKILRAQLRADESLQALEKVLKGGDAKRAPREEAAALDEQEASLNVRNPGDLSEIAARTHARIRKSL